MFRAILKRANLEAAAGLDTSIDQAPDGAIALADGPAPDTNRATPADPDEIRDGVIAVLKTIHDPEIPVNIHDLGLIYDVLVDADGRVQVRMTLTSPNCPEAQSLPASVRRGAESVPGVTEALVDVVWDPPWDMNKMTEAARLKLNMF